MRHSLLVRTLALMAGTVLTFPSGSPARAASDVLDQAACLVRGAAAPDVALRRGAGADRYDFAWMEEREHLGRAAVRRPYVVRVADAESPRSLIQHDRLVLPGTPADWVAAPHGVDLVLCARRVPAVIVVERQFCTGPVSAGDVANGEIEEITFLEGTTWLADDLAAQVDGKAVPEEMAEDLRHEVAMASPAGRGRDPDFPQAIAYAPEVAATVDRWTITPMSQALGVRAGAAAGCLGRQADLRARIMPTKRSNR